MSVLLLEKILSIFLHNPTYKRDGLKMWSRILERYKPRGKDALFEIVSALYTLEQVVEELIIAYISCACRLFSGLHGITFNTMADLFIIVNPDHY